MDITPGPASSVDAAARVGSFLDAFPDVGSHDIDGHVFRTRDLAVLVGLAREIERLRATGTAGEVDAAFYRVIADQRDLAWTAQTRATAELAQVRAVLRATFARADAAEEALTRVVALADRLPATSRVAREMREIATGHAGA